MIESVTSALKKRFCCAGWFGTFSVKDRAARSGRNPQTGDPITIPAKVPSFKASKALKDALN